jgi:hypothetical protein
MTKSLAMTHKMLGKGIGELGEGRGWRTRDG